MRCQCQLGQTGESCEQGEWGRDVHRVGWDRLVEKRAGKSFQTPLCWHTLMHTLLDEGEIWMEREKSEMLASTRTDPREL